MTDVKSYTEDQLKFDTEFADLFNKFTSKVPVAYMIGIMKAQLNFLEAELFDKMLKKSKESQDEPDFENDVPF